MANMSTSENITWFPLTPALFEENYRGVAVIMDDILRGGNITANSESRPLASSYTSGRPPVHTLAPASNPAFPTDRSFLVCQSQSVRRDGPLFQARRESQMRQGRVKLIAVRLGRRHSRLHGPYHTVSKWNMAGHFIETCMHYNLLDLGKRGSILVCPLPGPGGSLPSSTTARPSLCSGEPCPRQPRESASAPAPRHCPNVPIPSICFAPSTGFNQADRCSTNNSACGFNIVP